MRTDPTHVRRLLWLQLLEVADRINELADQWLANDPDLADLERLVSGDSEQPDLPFGCAATDELPF